MIRRRIIVAFGDYLLMVTCYSLYYRFINGKLSSLDDNIFILSHSVFLYTVYEKLKGWTIILDKGTKELNDIFLGADERMNIISDKGTKKVDYNAFMRAIEIVEMINDERAKELKYEKLKIKNEFLKADEVILSQLETSKQYPDTNYMSQVETDEIIPLQSETQQRNPDAIYTSQFIYFFLQ
ncbi:1097_t:CDS:2 [Cetraspora pellucida]|uniref:1097_t:CDS:1 n=1 Tax=Cetraspora pellucida TaxID=1433469 RepID=A0ACA9N5G8_9GLOM|nr:1097_t:CDS:2 [Cetraspora pellucida]